MKDFLEYFQQVWLYRFMSILTFIVACTNLFDKEVQSTPVFAIALIVGGVGELIKMNKK